MIFHTIGVYNSTEEAFFNNLTSNNIDTFIDIRQRRGVRGTKYKFVNSLRLQEHLQQIDVNYIHIKSLAPTKEIRDKQKEADKLNGNTKTSRETLGSLFTSEYKKIIIDNYDFPSFIQLLNNMGSKNIALFCVEEKPEACHRSIVSNQLEKMGYNIEHI